MPNNKNANMNDEFNEENLCLSMNSCMESWAAELENTIWALCGSMSSCQGVWADVLSTCWAGQEYEQLWGSMSSCVGVWAAVPSTCWAGLPGMSRTGAGAAVWIPDHAVPQTLSPRLGIATNASASARKYFLDIFFVVDKYTIVLVHKACHG